MSVWKGISQDAIVMNTDDMAYGGSGYPTGTDINGCVEAIEEPYNGKPSHISINIPPLAGLYLIKVADPKPKKVEKKAVKAPAKAKAPAKKAPAKAAKKVEPKAALKEVIKAKTLEAAEGTAPAPAKEPAKAKAPAKKAPAKTAKKAEPKAALKKVIKAKTAEAIKATEKPDKK